MGDGYARDLAPLAGERELDRLSGLWDLVEPFALSSVLTLAGASQGIVVCSEIGKGREAVLVAFAADWEGQDFSASPWWIKTMSRNGRGGTGQPQDDGRILMGPFFTPVGALTTPFIMPFPLPIGQDSEVGIVQKNGLGQSFDVSAFIYGLSWSKEQTRDVRRALWEARRSGIELWEPGLFGGEKKGGRS